MYWIIDIKKSRQSETLIYWRRDQKGYTDKPQCAGLFDEYEATEIVKHNGQLLKVKFKL